MASHRHDDHDDDHDCELELNPRTSRLDPALAARSVELTDEESKMSFVELEYRAREVELAQIALRVAMGHYVAASEAFRMRLMKQYPQIDPPSALASSPVRWKDKFYFVSWDEHNEE